MNENQAKKLLEEIIRETLQEVSLKEQTDFRSDVLFKAFVEPFTDIVQTAAHGVEKITAHATGELKLLAKQMAYLFLPFLNPDAGSLKNMSAQERQKIAQKLSGIDDKFKDVLDRNWQAWNNPDVWGTLFLLHPQLAISQKMISKAPELALGILEVLTGGSEAVSSILQGYRNLKTGGGRVATRSHQGGYDGGSPGYGDDYGDYGGFYEQMQPQPAPARQPSGQGSVNVPRPAPKQNPEAWLKSELTKLVSQPAIQKQIGASPITKAMQQEAVNKIVSSATKELSFAFSDLKTKLGSNYQKAIESLQGEQKEQITSELETNQELQKKIVEDIKALLKPAYIKQLQGLLSLNPGLKRTVDQAIQKINAL